MPIYDQAYKPWEGQLLPNPKAWWVIAKTGIRLMWQKWVIVLLVFSSFPFAVRGVQIYLMNRVGDSSQLGDFTDKLEINPGFFEGFLKGQTFLFLLILAIIGAGLIANDRRFKALQIYFSKPLSFWDYVGGKMLVLAFYSALITVVPAILLFIIQLLLSGDSTFLVDYYWIPFSILAIWMISVLVLGGLILTLSASVNNSAAAILFFAILMFSDIIRKILSRIPDVGLASIGADIQQVTAVLFGNPRPHDFSPYGAWIALLLVVGICLLILRLRLRPTEVVK
ncbi:hypothetical protein HQ585_01330 [candidate division KSB1 bacterium]|nr:hypothetical protein [candidate division KSB1 bacterium]